MQNTYVCTHNPLRDSGKCLDMDHQIPGYGRAPLNKNKRELILIITLIYWIAYIIFFKKYISSIYITRMQNVRNMRFHFWWSLALPEAGLGAI